MTSTPLVSVLMPVWNTEAYVAPAIESILNQTFKDFEFLILDDASTDRSVPIIKSFDDPRIQLISNKEKCDISVLLNAGLRLARGKYIARMDSDDISLPERLWRQVDFLERHTDVGLCATNGFNMSEEGRILPGPWWADGGAPIEWMLFWQTPIAHPTVMIRAETLEANDIGYDPPSAEDAKLWAKLAVVTKVVRLREPLLHYRIRNAGLFNRTYKESLRQAIVASRFLARAISGVEPPKVHELMTLYSQDLREPCTASQLREAVTWVQRLLLKAKSYWNWDEGQLAAAREYTLKLFAGRLSSVTGAGFAEIRAIFGITGSRPRDKFRAASAIAGPIALKAASQLRRWISK